MMGSPLGPSLANLFLANLECEFMQQPSLNCIPHLYLRYVDDVFCVFDSNSKVQSFLNFLNNLHPNLKFTCEIGQQSLPFLDTVIHIDATLHLTEDMSLQYIENQQTLILYRIRKPFAHVCGSLVY